MGKNFAINSNYKLRKHSIRLADIAVSLMLFFNYFFKTDYLALIATILACLLVLSAELTRVPSLAVYFSLFSYITTFSGYNIYIFIVISTVLRIVLVSANKLKTIAMIFLLYFATHLISSIGTTLKFGDYIPFFAILSLCTVTIVYKVGGKRDVYVAFLIGHVISSIMGMFKAKTRLGEVLITNMASINNWKDTFRFSGLTYDANFYSVLSVIAMCILVFDYQSVFKKGTIHIVLIIATFAFGIMTLSKSLFLCYCMIILVSLFCSNSAIKKKILPISVFMIIAYMTFKGQIFSMINAYSVRFSGIENADDLTTGRSTLWVIYFNAIISSVKILFIGAGIHGELLSIKAAHNIYLEIIYKFGIIGLLVDIGYLLYSMKKIKKTKKTRFSDAFCVSLLATLLFNLSAYTFSTLWTCLFIIIVMIRDGDEYDIGNSTCI